MFFHSVFLLQFSQSSYRILHTCSINPRDTNYEVGQWHMVNVSYLPFFLFAWCFFSLLFLISRQFFFSASLCFVFLFILSTRAHTRDTHHTCTTLSVRQRMPCILNTAPQHSIAPTDDCQIYPWKPADKSASDNSQL